MKQFYQKKISYSKGIINKKLLHLAAILLFGSVIEISAQNCTINAGVLNQTICETDVMQLIGNTPTPIIGTVHWTQISGPSVVITSPTSSTTTVTGYAGGNSYVFRFSAICGDGIASFQDKTVVVKPITKANAGNNVASCPNSSGSVIITGNAPLNPGETGHWEIGGANGAGLTINFPNSAISTVTLPPGSCGTTTLNWVIEGPEYAPGQRCMTSSSITATNYGGVSPVSAGTDIILSNCYTTTQSTTLNGSFGGCGLNGQIGTWAFVSGPNNPTIANANANSTNVSNLMEGTYTFRWTVTGPCATGNDIVTVTVPPATQDVTTLSGGDENINFCDNTITQVTLQAQTPLYAGETVQWIQVSGATLPPGSIVSPNSATTLVKNLSDAGDPYRFRYTLTNSITGCIFTKDYVIEYKGSMRTITAQTGDDVFGVCAQTDFTIPLTVTGTGQNTYRILSGPVASPLGPFPTADIPIGNSIMLNLVAAGTYIVQFMRSETGSLPVGCDYGFDSVAIVVSELPTSSNAGSDVNLACGVTTGPLSGVTATPAGSHYWSQLSGPNMAIVADNTAQNTTVSGLISGSYVFQYIVKGGGSTCGFSIDTVTINVSEATLSNVDAGPDQLICANSEVILGANTPLPGEFGVWTKVSGPDTIVFTDVNDPNTVATGFNTPGQTNVLRWTIAYLNPGPTGCSGPASDDMTVTTNFTIGTTVANAGPDMCYQTGTTSITLSANTPQGTETGTWAVTPSAGIVFADINNPTTTVTIPADGTYAFIWTINPLTFLCSSSHDTVIITVAEDPSTANAGPDQNICGTTVVMDASLSSGSVGKWSRVSGFGEYTISNINDPNATFIFTHSGFYVFRWTSNAGICTSAFDDINITIGIPPGMTNAGPDQDICGNTTATMAATPYDIFFETGEWSLLSGAPNVPMVIDAMDPNTLITGLITGTYTFRWTVSSKENFLCPTTFDDIVINVSPLANAGADQTYCDVASVQLIGTEDSTGTWTLTGGPPVGVTITQSPGNSFIANASVVPGNNYEFTYTTDAVTFPSGGTCAGSSDSVNIQIFSGASIDPNAGPDQTVCRDDVAATVTLAGNSPPVDVSSAEWRWVNRPSGSIAVITTPSSPTTTVTNLTVPGLYILEWVFINPNCRNLSDIVRINVFAPPSTANAGPDDTVACQLTYVTNAVAPTMGNGMWSFALPGDDPSGGTTVIDNPNNPKTTLSNIVLGTYVLTWTVTNGPFSNPSSCQPSVDKVVITFNQVPPSIANAGPDQELCAVTSTNLAAVPLTSGLGTWTQVSGPNTANIATPNNPGTFVFGLTNGTYVFKWKATTLNNDGCFSEDTMQVTIFEQPITTDAGPDQIVPQFVPVVMNAMAPTIGQGTWIKVSGPTFIVTFSDIHSNTTSLSGLAPGTYVFEWIISNGPCSITSDQVTIKIVEIADLELQKSVTPTIVNSGNVVTFSISVFNNADTGGGVTATGVGVKDIIPTGYTLVPGSISNGGIYNTGDFSIIWAGLTVPYGSTRTLTFKATVNPTGNYINTAQITASDQLDPDSTPNNNVPTEDDQDDAAVTLQSADLSLQKSVTPGVVSIGQNVVFTIQVSNAGPNIATNVTVRDQLPPGYSYVSSTGAGTYNQTTGIWTIGTINNGANASRQITAKVKTVVNLLDYQNIAQVASVDQLDPDSTPNNNVSTEDDQDDAVITLQQADLELVKTAMPTAAAAGDVIVFTLTLSNKGPGNATGVAIEDYLPNGYTLVPGSVSNGGIYQVANSTLIWQNLTLTSGGTLSLTFSAVLNAGGNHLNTAQIIASDLPDPDSTPNNDDGDQSEDDESNTLVIVNPDLVDLSLNKIVVLNNSTPLIGSQISFEIRVTNSGSNTATGVKVKDLLPSGYDYVLFSSTSGDYNEITGLWNVGIINSGTTEILLLTVNVNPTGDYLNIAEVTACDQPDVDSTPNNGITTEDDYDSVLTIPVMPAANLSLTKTIVGGNSTPLVGSQISFEIVVSNAGPQNATGVQITDLLPTGYTYSIFSATAGTYNNVSGVWSIGTLAVGDSETLIITATVNMTGNYLNIAEVTASNQIDPNSTPNNGIPTEDDYGSAIITPITNAADLSLTKTIVGGNTTPLVGSQISFEIVVTNNGPQNATAVTVKDLLPSGYTYTIFSTSSGTYNSTTGIWAVGSLLSDDSENLIITATVNMTGNYLNVAEINTSDLPDPDSTPGNGITTEDDYDSVITFPINAASDLSLTKKVVGGISTPLVGSQISFEIEVSNAGPQDATGVQVTDLLPSGYTFVLFSSTIGNYNETTGIWNVGTIARGTSQILIITVTVNPTGNYLNIAEVTASDLPDPDSTPNNGISTEDDYGSVIITPVNTAADLSLTKSIVGGITSPLIGSQITFDVSVSNAGPQGTTGVTVTDLLPTGYTFVSYNATQGSYNSSTGLWTLGAIAAATTETLQITVTVNTTGNYLNIAEVTTSALPDPNSTPGNGVTTENDYDSIATTPVALAADLSLTKTVNNATPLVGSQVIFEIELTNSGPQNTTGVAVTDLLPSGYTYNSFNATQGTYNSTTGVWTIGSIINGASVSLQLTGTVNITGNYTNKAEVTASDLPDPDSTPNNGIPTEDDYATATTVPVNIAADLSLTKSIVGGTTSPLVGSQITFDVSVSNAGPQGTTGVTVTDLLPTGYTFVSYNATQGSYNAATGLWTLGAIATATTETLQITVIVNATGNYLNIAEVTTSALPDPDSTLGNGVTTEDDYDSITTTPVTLAADLSLTKTVNNATPLVGSQVIFEIELTNSGPQNTTGVAVTDLLPSGYTYVSFNATQGTYNSTTGVWTIGSIINGASVSLQLTAIVNTTGNYTNKAEVTASDLPDPDSTPSNGVTTEDDYATATTVPVNIVADLSLTKSIVGGITSPLVGSQITFDVSVSNVGPQDTAGVTVTDLLPTGYTFVSSNTTQGNYNAATGLWTIGGMATGTTETLQIIVTVNATGNYLNIAEVTTSALPDPDSTPGNGIPTEDDYDSITTTPVTLVADLSLTKTVNNVTPLVGSQVIFEIEVTNSGPQDVTGVKATDLLPSGYTYISFNATQGTYNSITGLWTIGNIINGASVSLQLTAIVNATGNYTNSAEITASSLPDLDSTPGNGITTEDDYGSVTVVPVILAADLSLTKTVNNATPLVGTQVVFEIVVTNSGPQDATGVKVTDLLPSGYTYNSFNATQGTYSTTTGIWNIGSLMNGASESLQLTATVNMTGNYTNTTEITASNLPDLDSTPGNGITTEDDYGSVTVVPVILAADLSLTKTVNNATPLVGTQVVFEIVVTNSGPQDATGVKVTDLLPSGYTYNSFNATQGTYSTTTGIWNIGSLMNGASESLQLTATVNMTGNYTNTTEITASNLPDPDSTPNNGITTEDDYASVTTIPIITAADLSLIKTVNNSTPFVGSQVIFEIIVTNSGPQDATGVVIRDLLPSGYTYNSFNATKGIYNAVTGIWNIGSLMDGVSESLQLTATVNMTGNYTNIAEVTASDLPDPDSTPNNGIPTEDDYGTATVVPIIVLADLSIEKTVIGNNVNPDVNDIITFQVMIHNDGPGNTTGVVVKDLLPAGFSYVSHSATGGSYIFMSGIWNVGEILNGGSQTLLISARVNPPTGIPNEYINIAEVTASNLPDPDSTPNNGITTEDDYDSVEVFVKMANLSLKKSVSNINANVGEVVTFTVQINNAGPSIATGVDIQDLLPKGYDNISNITNSGIYNGSMISWTNLTIPLTGVTLSYQGTVILPIGLKPTDYVNTVQVMRSNEFDPNSTPGNDNGDHSEDDESFAYIEIPRTDIAINKEVDITNPAMYSTVVFTITADNVGNLAATNVQVADVLPNGYEFISATASSGVYNPSSGVWDIPVIPINSLHTLAITVKVIDKNDYLNKASLFALDQIDTNLSNNEDEATIQPNCLKIYNEFSPDGDGSNDVFYIDCISSYPDNILEVFNRWGNKVYSRKGYNNTWDGTSDGAEKTLPVGTYFYILDLGNGTSKISGWLYIKR